MRYTEHMTLHLPQDLIDRALAEDMRIMFHGTASLVDTFSHHRIGKGGDDNSALGLHLAEFPSCAADFAGTAEFHNEGVGGVLVVLVPAQNPYEITSYETFFGFDENGNPDAKMGKAGFEALRIKLLQDGYDIVDYEDGEMGAVSVVLDPTQVQVLGSLTVEQAYEVDEVLSGLGDTLDTKNKIQALRAVLPTSPSPRRAKP